MPTTRLALAENTPSPLPARDSRRILIVDDEAVIRDLCSRALKGYHVQQAASGAAALAMFEHEPADVVLTDVMMPGMNGIELLRQLKEREPTLVVIVMTGFAEKDVILNALKADADDFITKPINLLQLKTAIDRALEKKALKEELANLHRLDRFKSNFLSCVSHKFRTPLTAISLFLQNLGAGVYDPAEPESRRYLNLVIEETAHLEHLVADLLVFSQALDDGRELRLVPCELGPLLTELVGGSLEVARKPLVRHRLDLEALPPLLADREKLAFALRQVIDNAFKFSRESGEVTISLYGEADEVRIVVADTGSGIPHDDLPKVFEKFYQVDAEHTGQVRGFGLGLAYARDFIRAHGGSIAIDSTLGSGTVVTISLPRR